MYYFYYLFILMILFLSTLAINWYITNFKSFSWFKAAYPHVSALPHIGVYKKNILSDHFVSLA